MGSADRRLDGEADISMAVEAGEVICMLVEAGPYVRRLAETTRRTGEEACIIRPEAEVRNIYRRLENTAVTARIHEADVRVTRRPGSEAVTVSCVTRRPEAMRRRVNERVTRVRGRCREVSQ